MAFKLGKSFDDAKLMVAHMEKLKGLNFTRLESGGESLFPLGYKGVGTVIGALSIEDEKDKNYIVLLRFKAKHPNGTEKQDSVAWFGEIPANGTQIHFEVSENARGMKRNKVSEVPAAVETTEEVKSSEIPA